MVQAAYNPVNKANEMNIGLLILFAFSFSQHQGKKIRSKLMFRLKGHWTSCLLSLLLQM